MSTTTAAPVTVSFTLDGFHSVALHNALAVYNATQEKAWNLAQATALESNSSYVVQLYVPLTAAQYAVQLAQQQFQGIASGEIMKRLKDPAQGPALSAFLTGTAAKTPASVTPAPSVTATPAAKS